MKKKNLLGTESLAEKMAKVKQQMESEGQVEQLPVSYEQVPEPIIRPDPKLFVSGRLDRKTHTYVAKSLLLNKKLEEQIVAYCRGGDLVILNYLIMQGLKHVLNTEQVINIDMEDIENKIKEAL